jgi:hypothetical protein
LAMPIGDRLDESVDTPRQTGAGSLVSQGETVKKSKAIRLAGFAAALCASGALIGTSISGTGAYFTDAKSGSINASTGAIKVDISPADGNLSFNNLLPGNYQTNTVTYGAHPVGGTEDIWLVFPTGPAGGTNPSEAFTGNPSDSAGGGLGRFGHFALASSGGANFTSYNLNNPGTGTHTGTLCSRDDNGWGGSNAQPTTPTDTTTAAFCAPSNAILLQSNMANGDTGTVDMTFGFTPLLKNQSQYASSTPIVSYQIVATQHGIRPDNAFNG